MASAAEQLAASINFGAFSKATELKNRIWFTLGALVIYRLGTYIPIPGIDAGDSAGNLLAECRRHSRHVRHVLGRRARAHDDLRPQHHAVHLGLDHHPAVDGGFPDPRKPEKGGRERAQEAQPIHPLRHRAAGRGAVLRHRRRARGDARRRAIGGDRSGAVLPARHRRHADRRHRLSDVARRADHRARHRQRHLADHHGRHRRQSAARAGRDPGTRPHRRDLDRLHHHLPADGGRGRRS